MAQFLRPDSDISNVGWHASSSYVGIDEESYVDTDYLLGLGDQNGTVEVGLSNVSDPGSSSGHTVRFRAWQQNKTNQRGLVCYLVQGSTVIASYTISALPKDTVGTAYSFTLTSTEADTITDYTDLRIRFESTGDVGIPNSNRAYVYVSWAEVEVPDAGPSGVSGSLSSTLDGITVSAAGTVNVSGSANQTFENVSLSGTGTVSVSGSADLSFDGMILDAAGSVGSSPIEGVLSASFGDMVLSGSGTVSVAGGLDVSFADMNLDASGSIESSPIEGALSTAFDGMTIYASGTVGYNPINAELSTSFDDMDLDAAGEVEITGDTDQTFEDMSLLATAVVSISGAAVTDLDGFVLNGYGVAGALVTIALSLPARTVDLSLGSRDTVLGLPDRDTRIVIGQRRNGIN